MSNWREPITDRTLQDVKNFDAGSLSYQKGTLNADDLNRIEDNYKYLMAKLRSDAIFIPHRLRNFTETVLEYVEKENSILPDGYTPVEYIQSSGTQYIDTGFMPNNNTRVVMDVEPLPSISSADVVTFFGARANGLYFALMNPNTNGYNVYWEYYGYYENIWAISSVSDFAKRRVVEVNGESATFDGVTKTYTPQTFQLGYSLYLLASNEAGNMNYSMPAKLYSCQIYDNGTLVRNFIPCTDITGVAGLYDLVGKTFYGNAGSGTFAVGAAIENEQAHELVETTTTYTDWQEHNLPWLSEINRIRANYNALVRLFLVGLGLPVLAESNYLDYVEVNDWERIAEVGKTMFENMEKEYRYCGMEESGGDRLL